MATNIANLAVLLTSDASKFTKDIDRSLKVGERRFGAFAGKVKAAAAVAGAALAAMAVKAFNDTRKAADEQAKLADRLGLTTKALEGFRLAANLSGSEAGVLDMAMQRMTRRMSEAAMGTGEAKDALRELGLDAAALVKAGPEQALYAISDALNDVELQSDRVRLAQKLFDSEGVGLLNMLAMGSDGLRQMVSEADQLGIAFSRVDAAKFERFNDMITRLKAQLTGARNQIVLEFMPAIEAAADLFRLLGDRAEENWGKADLSLAQHIEGTMNRFHKNMAALTERVVGFAADTMRTFETLWDGMADLARRFQEPVDAVLTGIESLVNGAMSAMTGTIETVLNALIAQAEAAANAVIAAANKVRSVSTFGTAEPLSGVKLDRVEIEAPKVDLAEAEDIAAAFDGAAERAGGWAESLEAIRAQAAAAGKEFEAEFAAIGEASEEAAAATGRSFERIGTDAAAAAEKAGAAARGTSEAVAKETSAIADRSSADWAQATASMENALVDFMEDGRLELGDFEDELRRAVARIVANWVAEWAQGAQQTDNIWAGLAQAAAGYFGGGGGGGGGSTKTSGGGGSSGGGWGDAIAGAAVGYATGGWVGAIAGAAGGFFEDGGRPPMGKVSVVGERGPELFVPDQAGTVLPNHMLGGGGGGRTVVVNQSFESGLTMSELQPVLAGLKEDVMAGVLEAVSRGGGFRRAIRY